MKRQWLSLRATIFGTTAIAAIYLTCLVSGVRLDLVLALFLLSIVALIYLVLRILKDPWSTDKTFDDYFYQDRDDLRRQGPK